jgi:hypothetical protein
MKVTKSQLEKVASEFQNNPTKQNESKFQLYSEAYKMNNFFAVMDKSIREDKKKIFGEGK